MLIFCVSAHISLDDEEQYSLLCNSVQKNLCTEYWSHSFWSLAVNICLLLLLFVSRLCWQVHQTWNVDFLGSYSYSGVQIHTTVLSSPTGNMAFKYVYIDPHLPAVTMIGGCSKMSHCYCHMRSLWNVTSFSCFCMQ